ncbi:unnamed protein product [Scytosiphon promiscuus]
MSSGSDDDSETSSTGEDEVKAVLYFACFHALISLVLMGTIDMPGGRTRVICLQRQRPQMPWAVSCPTCPTIIFAILWPMIPLLMIPIALLKPFRLLYVLHRRRRARRDVSRSSIESRSWEDRGWLVMLRVRYLRSLEQAQNTPWRPSFSTGRKGQTKRSPFKLDVVRSAHAAVGDERQTRLGQMGREEDIERGEVPWIDWEFAKVVAHITEIDEEGLFREVISYI